MTTHFDRRGLLGQGLGFGLGLGFDLALATGPTFAQTPLGFIVLKTADGREVRIYRWRAQGRRRGSILFSHGANSAPWKYAPLTESWTTAGYDVLAPLHVDSTDHPDRAVYPATASWKARMEDVHLLAATIQGRSYIAAGHSYGALVALTLGGAAPIRPRGYTGPMRDPRVAMVLAYSPPGLMPGFIDAAGYAALAVPALIQTGDKDVPIGSTDPNWRQHLAAYEAAAPGGNRYALTLDGVDHYFGGLICRPELPGPKQTLQMQAAIEITGLFIGSFGRGLSASQSGLQARLGRSGTALLEQK